MIFCSRLRPKDSWIMPIDVVIKVTGLASIEIVGVYAKSGELIHVDEAKAAYIESRVQDGNK